MGFVFTKFANPLEITKSMFIKIVFLFQSMVAYSYLSSQTIYTYSLQQYHKNNLVMALVQLTNNIITSTHLLNSYKLLELLMIYRSIYDHQQE